MLSTGITGSVPVCWGNGVKLVVEADDADLHPSAAPGAFASLVVKASKRSFGNSGSSRECEGLGSPFAAAGRGKPRPLWSN